MALVMRSIRRRVVCHLACVTAIHKPSTQNEALPPSSVCVTPNSTRPFVSSHARIPTFTKGTTKILNRVTTWSSEQQIQQRCVSTLNDKINTDIMMKGGKSRGREKGKNKLTAKDSDPVVQTSSSNPFEGEENEDVSRTRPYYDVKYDASKNPFEEDTAMINYVKTKPNVITSSNPFETEMTIGNHVTGNPFDEDTGMSCQEKTKDEMVPSAVVSQRDEEVNGADCKMSKLCPNSPNLPNSETSYETNSNSVRGDSPVLDTTTCQHTHSVEFPNSHHDNNSSTSFKKKTTKPGGEFQYPSSPTDTIPSGGRGDSDDGCCCCHGNASDDGDIVLVTGANGFLGQHIVKMLQMKSPHVKEIWALDKDSFRQKLDYQGNKPVKVFVGDVTDANFVSSTIRGATSVLHIAGLVSFGTFPDMDGMQNVNVNGTLNVVNACLKWGVSRLVYCSTVDVAVGHQPIRGGDEENTPVPQDFLFPGYPNTKYQGERLVLDSSKSHRKDDPPLQTLALRANVMYGELDPFYVTSGLKMAKQRKGILNQIGDGHAMFQQSYVGNTAWAFVCADCAMRSTPDLTSHFFYVPDNTPIQNTFNFMRPYLEARGFQLSEKHIPYSLIYGAILASEKVAKLVSPLKKLNLPTQSCSISYINTDLYFKGDKAKRVLKYEPLYTPSDARVVSMEYYTNVEL